MNNLALDLGGSKIGVLLSRDGQTITDCVYHLKDIHNPQMELLSFCYALKNILKEACINNIEKCVIASAGSISQDGVINYWPNLKAWEGINIINYLSRVVNAKINAIDDCHAAAYAEAFIRQCEHVLYIGIGSGIGGGLVYQGKIIEGATNLAVNIGHIIVNTKGPLCACGQRGCLQTYISGRAMARRVFKSEVVNMDTYYHFLEASKTKKSANNFLIQGLRYLHRVLHESLNLFDPAVIVIGGGLGLRLAPELLNICDNKYHDDKIYRNKLPIELSKYGEKSSLIGAKLLAEHKYAH